MRLSTYCAKAMSLHRRNCYTNDFWGDTTPAVAYTSAGSTARHRGDQPMCRRRLGKIDRGRTAPIADTPGCNTRAADRGRRRAARGRDRQDTLWFLPEMQKPRAGRLRAS